MTFAPRRAAAMAMAAWVGTGCGRLIGIDTITYAPEGDAKTRDAARESDVPDAKEGGSPGDADATFDVEVEASAESDAPVRDAPFCDLDATASDKHNCGRCGHDCLGGECRSSRCTPVLIAGALARPNGIVASNDGFVYWVDAEDGTVRRAGKSVGIPPAIIGHGIFPGLQIAVDDTYAYYTAYTRPGSLMGGINRVLKDGTGDVEVVISNFAAARGLVLDDHNVFYAGGVDPTAILRAPKGTSDSYPLYVSSPVDADPLPSLVGIAKDDQYVYATDIGSNLVLRVRLDADNTHSPTIFSGTRARPYSIRVDGDFVFWADAYAIYRKSRLDPTDEGNPISNASLVNVIAVDATDVYFSESTLSGGVFVSAVRRIGKDAQYGMDMPIDVTDALWSDIRGLAVDDEAIYFTADDSVLKIAK